MLLFSFVSQYFVVPVSAALRTICASVATGGAVHFIFSFQYFLVAVWNAKQWEVSGPFTRPEIIPKGKRRR
jgi:hypothetical protein